MQKGSLFVVSAPAGCGKDTILNELLKKTDKAGYAVSATTRAPREGEVNGVHYHFLTREEFERRIAEKEVLEYTEYCGNFYGTPLKEAEEVLASGKNLILEIEVEGAQNVKKAYPDAVLIMLLPPSFAVQEARLRGRGTETEEKIRLRLERTREEIAQAFAYDYVVYNHDGKDTEAAEEICAIVCAEQAAMKRNLDRVNTYFG